MFNSLTLSVAMELLLLLLFFRLSAKSWQSRTRHLCGLHTHYDNVGILTTETAGTVDV